jgi:hypothetical protein
MTPRIALFAGIMLLVSAACRGSAAVDDLFRLAASGLCEATAKAEMGDTAGGEEVFFDVVHQPLHDLADATAEVDRAAAARLLEAKQAVEAGLDAGQPDMGEAFQALVVATDAALATTGHDGMPCPP